MLPDWIALVVVIIFILIAVIFAIRTDTAVADAAEDGEGDGGEDDAGTDFALNPEYVDKNREGAIVNFYEDNVRIADDGGGVSDVVVVPNAMSPTIATLNVHHFDSINKRDTPEESMRAVLDFMDAHNVGVLCLQEVPMGKRSRQFHEMALGRGLHTTHHVGVGLAAMVRGEPILLNMVVSRYPLADLKCLILPTEAGYESRMRHAIFFRVPDFPDSRVAAIPRAGDRKGPSDGQFVWCCTHLEIAERELPVTKHRIRTAQLRRILDEMPRILIGDLNFNDTHPEYGYISQYMVTDVVMGALPTTPFGTTVDYIWFAERDPTRSCPIKCRTVPFPYSDHRAVVTELLL